MPSREAKVGTARVSVDNVDTPGEPQSAGATAMPVSVKMVGSHFKTIFLSVLLLEVMLIIGMVVMSLLVVNPTQVASGAISTCTTLVTTGFGAICGLIGGKAI